MELAPMTGGAGFRNPSLSPSHLPEAIIAAGNYQRSITIKMHLEETAKGENPCH